MKNKFFRKSYPIGLIALICGMALEGSVLAEDSGSLNKELRLQAVPFTSRPNHRCLLLPMA